MRRSAGIRNARSCRVMCAAPCRMSRALRSTSAVGVSGRPPVCARAKVGTVSDELPALTVADGAARVLLRLLFCRCRRERSALRHDPDVRVQEMPEELADQLASAELTYHHAGATKTTLPAGYHHQNAAKVIGKGAETFGVAAAELIGWQAHLRAGLRVTASTATAVPGTVVLLGIGVGPLRMRAPCRSSTSSPSHGERALLTARCRGIQSPARKPSASASTTTAWSSSPSPRCPARQPPQHARPGRSGS